jgi:transposase
MARKLKEKIAEAAIYIFHLQRAAFTSEWSNGQVEGQVNRLKLQKRMGYGRANFDLLRLRVLARA